MIVKLDTVLTNLEKEKVKQLEDLAPEKAKASEDELVHIEELMTAIKKIRNVPDDSKMAQIQHILGRLDDDFDGQLKVDDVLKVFNLYKADMTTLFFNVRHKSFNCPKAVGMSYVVRLTVVLRGGEGERNG